MSYSSEKWSLDLNSLPISQKIRSFSKILVIYSLLRMANINCIVTNKWSNKCQKETEEGGN